MDLQSNSVSFKFRQEGNQIYKSIYESLSIIIKESRLNECLNLYQKSINTASTFSELASAYKNHSVISFELLKLNLFKSKKLTVYYMKEMQHSIKNAINYGKLSNMCIDWLNDLSSKALDGFEEFCKVYINGEEEEEKVVDLLLHLKETSIETVKCFILYKLSLFYYHSSIKQIEYDVNLSYRSINECRFYSEECYKLSKEVDYEINFDIEEMISNRSLQECLIDGLRYYNIAEKSLDQSINYEESLNVAFIWNCIDLYHEAIVRTKDKDIELEAKIKSKLGYIYMNILKLKNTAMKYFYDSFNLAESMKPKLFTHQSWFVRACNEIKKSQNEKLNEENKAKEKIKEKVKNKIENDLDKIKKEAQKNNKAEFLKFVIKNYKVKNSTETINVDNLETLAPNELKKTLKSVIVIYHPDKNSGDENMESGWYFIAEEISKYLSSFYEELK